MDDGSAAAPADAGAGGRNDPDPQPFQETAEGDDAPGRPGQPGEGEEPEAEETLRTEVTDRLLTLAKQMAGDRQGAMFVIADEGTVRPVLDIHYPQLRHDGSVLDQGFGAVLAKLASLDGAVAVAPDGRLLAYGARLRTQSTLPGFGTRHAAAKGYSEHDPGATVILASEETGWTKVFQDGRVVLEIDPSDVEPSVMRKLSRYLVSKDAAILTAAGISVATLGLGTVGLLVLGGSYVVVKTAMDTITGVLGGRRGERGP